MRGKMAIWLAVLLAMGSLSGCSWWQSYETEETVETVEKTTEVSVTEEPEETKTEQTENTEETEQTEEASEQTAEKTEEISEDEIPAYPWEELTILETQEMTWVETGEESTEHYAYTSEDGMELTLSSGVTGWGAYLSINGEEYVFSEEDSSYYVSATSVPQVILYDINGDEVQDVVLWVPYSVAVGTAVEQNIYLSGEDGYIAMGSMAWELNEDTHAFTYSVELCDNYLVRISVPDYGIDSWVEMDEAFMKQAKALGLYDSEGKVTEYGGEWETLVSTEPVVYQAPFEENIECGLNADGEFVLRAYAPVASGYSSYKLGLTLVEDYKITDGAYVLSNINILEDQIYDMLTVNGSEFRVRDNVRGKSVHLVRVTEEGEKEIRTFEVRYGKIEPEDVTLTGVEDLMGYPAFYVDQYEDFDFLHVNYYYGVTDATVVELGEGFGNDPSENNFILDVNDDGEMELICCLEYRADGGHDVVIYFQQDGQVYRGEFGVLDEEEEVVYTHGTPSVKYLPGENMIEFTYLVKREDGQTEQKTQKYEATLDNLLGMYEYPSTK